MKKIITFCLLIAVLCTVFPVSAMADDVPAQSGCHGILSEKPIGGSDKLLDTAGSVILYELNTDTMVYSYHPDKQINPTGLVKLLTALIAIEEGNLDDTVTVYRTTLNTIAPGAVSAGLKAGEQLPLRDLLYCVMVSSANDAAAVIAAHIAGDQAAFVEKMNVRAKELGCTDSNFTNVHGLNDPDQYSTARDLAIIAQAALQNPTFAEMFSAVSYEVGPTNLSDRRKLRTTNYMMSDEYIQTELDGRVTGGKPAAATTTDRSMICTAEVGGMRYLCVVMNAKGEVSSDGLSVVRFGIFQEVKSLLNFGFDKMRVYQLADDAQVMYQHSVTGGDQALLLRPSRDISVVLPADYDPFKLQYVPVLNDKNIAAPISAGQKMGSLQILYGDLVLGSCSLLAMHDVSAPGQVIRPAQRYDVPPKQEDSGYSRIMILGCMALGAVLLLIFIIWLIVRLVRTADIRRMQRKRARTRKRGKKK